MRGSALTTSTDACLSLSKQRRRQPNALNSDLDAEAGCGPNLCLQALSSRPSLVAFFNLSVPSPGDLTWLSNSCHICSPSCFMPRSVALLPYAPPVTLSGRPLSIQSIHFVQHHTDPGNTSKAHPFLGYEAENTLLRRHSMLPHCFDQARQSPPDHPPSCYILHPCLSNCWQQTHRFMSCPLITSSLHLFMTPLHLQSQRCTHPGTCPQEGNE